MAKKTVFITGTSGSMGGAGLEILLQRKDRFNIVTLVRPSAKNKKMMRQYEREQALKIVWGDLTEYDDVLQCVSGADIVLHPAALIAPEHHAMALHACGELHTHLLERVAERGARGDGGGTPHRQG